MIDVERMCRYLVVNTSDPGASSHFLLFHCVILNFFFKPLYFSVFHGNYDSYSSPSIVGLIGYRCQAQRQRCVFYLHLSLVLSTFWWLTEINLKLLWCLDFKICFVWVHYKALTFSFVLQPNVHYYFGTVYWKKLFLSLLYSH